MRLLKLEQPVRNRRLLIIFGCLLIVAGFLAGLLDRPTSGKPSKSEAEKEAAAIDLVLATDLESDRTAAAESAELLSEFQARLAAIDLDSAPEPRPTLSTLDGADLYSGVTVEYLRFFFREIGYSREQAEATQARFVPPLVLLSIPAGWADERPVELKKSMFYRTVLPLALLENRRIRIARSKVESFARLQRNKTPIPTALRDEVKALAVRYGVRDAEAQTPLDAAAVGDLLQRVDIVPPSLTLAQAAYESGYGTSRFAVEGNALFGQWAWDEEAIRPEQHREALGTYGIRAFETPGDSVRAYLHNLNTHPAYAEFRALRARQRAAGDTEHVPLDSLALAGTLLAYSERGEAYTSDLQGMIRHNRLQDADQLRLIRGEPVLFN